MPLWRLEPNDLSNRHWNASTYKGPVIIRAGDADAAQLLAARAFGKATGKDFGDTVIVVPWDQHDLINTTKVQETDEYVEEGPSGIVHPPEALELAHRGYDL